MAMALKVLTIDDSKTLRMIVRGTLTPFGVEIVEAENGAIGIDQAKAHVPDIILLDFNMPVMDGGETLRTLKGDDSLKDIPVIMLTTEAAQETVVELAKVGLNGYIVKPFNKEDLIAKVHGLCPLYEGDKPPSDEELKEMASDASKTKVLAVDDKENVLNALAGHFDDTYKFMKAVSGTEAVTLIKKRPPDVLLLDIDMPGTSGTDVFRETVDFLRKAGTLVWGMALRTEDKDIQAAKRAGIENMLLKPFQPDDIAEMIAEIAAGGASRKKGAAKKYLHEHGPVIVLTIPPAGDASLRAFSIALERDICKELNDQAEEGKTDLVIDTSSALGDMTVARGFLALLVRAKKLSVRTRLVASTDGARKALAEYAETASLPTCETVEEAVAALTAT
jgi:two-component system cell cycle response regulator